MVTNELIKVLYVDDEAHNLTAFRASFRRFFDIQTAINVDDAFEILDKQPIDILITDQRMPHKLGTDLLAIAVEKYPEQMRILLTGYSDMDALKDAVNKGQIYKYLEKPWNDDEVISTINRAFQIQKLRAEQKMLNEKLSLTNEQLEFILRQKLLS